MKTAILAISLMLLAICPGFGQAKDADPADVGSLDAIMKAVYAVISGDAGQARNWDRMRSLFHKDARLIPAGQNKAGVVGARAFTVEEYIERSKPFMEKEGFFESELARRVETYGHIAHDDQLQDRQGFAEEAEGHVGE